ncbi:MAG: hypothetical protein DKINENOH_02597 [bacterium]|nr:hypothetical protein [bacterium]
MRERPQWFPLKPRNKRLPRETYEQPNIVWFFTIRAYLFQTPFVRDDLNRMVIDTLRETRESYGCNVFVYCLMPDHLHLLTSPREPGASVLTFTERFKGKTTNQSWPLGWKGTLWQPGSYDHGLRKEDDFREIAEYTLENPVRKHLCDTPEEWPWSGMIEPWPVGI